MTDHRSESNSSVGPATGARNPALTRRPREAPSIEEFSKGITGGDRALLGQALSLMESSLPGDLARAAVLLDVLESGHTPSIRVAISGSPGAGKSTLIDALGIHLTGLGHRVAVLAVDPSSARSGGSILGDKTRMPRLAADPAAFIRPTPTAGALGGVARRTRPALAVLEAAGYDVLILETVGVGQSETAARDMADFFLLLSLAGAGDELQGIKRGIIEVADAIAITKADGDNKQMSATAATRLRGALRLFPDDGSGWIPRVLTCSALDGTGITELWETATEFQRVTRDSGHWDRRRAEQRLLWFEEEVRARQEMQSGLDGSALRKRLREDVAAGRRHPFGAAAELIAP